MKSFSASSFAGQHTEALDRALEAVRDDPHALFTDFQWFLYEVQNTVWYTAASKRAVDKQDLGNLVAQMVNLAPQLTHGFVGARPGYPFAQHLIDAITSIEVVDSLEGYPDKLLEPGLDLFDTPDLPLFRVKAVVRRDGPDAQGRASIILVRSAHALMEGSDSALLTRSQSAGHGIMSDKSNKLPLLDRLGSTMTAWLTTSLHLVVGNLFSKGRKDIAFGSLAIKRSRLRALANRLGVRQRSLFFALVTHALNGEGEEGRRQKNAIACAYTMLDTNRNASDDDFFRVRALQTKFKVTDDFVSYVRAVDDTVGTVEKKDITKFQQVINATFSMHRLLHKVIPFVHTKRFWAFSAGVDYVLTLVPPHRLYGDITAGMVEPIYCGSFHPGQNLITFCPGKEYVTINCSMDRHLIGEIGKIEALLDRIEAMPVIAPRPAPADQDA